MKRLLLLAVLSVLMTGCAIRPINPALETVSDNAGYRWTNRPALPDNDPDTLLVLGGTRAAAFSYGVLEEFMRTPVGRAGSVHPMLSEVDLVTGVSGGSFTALTFGLHSDRIFANVSARFRDMIRLATLRRIAVVVVNARSNDDFSDDKHEAPLSAFELLMQSSSVPIDRFCPAAVYALEDVVRQWQLERKIEQDQRRLMAAAASVPELPDIDFSIINVSFDALPDEVERAFLLNLPTSQFLEAPAVDRLRKAAGTVLRASPPFRQLVRDMSGGVEPVASNDGPPAGKKPEP